MSIVLSQPKTVYHKRRLNSANGPSDPVMSFLQEQLDALEKAKEELSDYDCRDCLGKNTMLKATGGIEVCDRCASTRQTLDFEETRLYENKNNDESSTTMEVYKPVPPETTQSHKRVKHILMKDEKKENAFYADVEEGVKFMKTYMLHKRIEFTPSLRVEFESLLRRYLITVKRISCRSRWNIYAACLLETLFRCNTNSYGSSSRDLASFIENTEMQKVNRKALQLACELDRGEEKEMNEQAWSSVTPEQGMAFFQLSEEDKERMNKLKLHAPRSFDPHQAKDIHKWYEMQRTEESIEASEAVQSNTIIFRLAYRIRRRRREIISKLGLRPVSRISEIWKIVRSFANDMDPPAEEYDIRRLRHQCRLIHKQLKQDPKDKLAGCDNKTIAGTIILLSLLGTRRCNTQGKECKMNQSRIQKLTGLAHNSLSKCKSKVQSNNILPFILTEEYTDDEKDDDLFF